VPKAAARNIANAIHHAHRARLRTVDGFRGEMGEEDYLAKPSIRANCWPIKRSLLRVRLPPGRSRHQAALTAPPFRLADRFPAAGAAQHWGRGVAMTQTPNSIRCCEPSARASAGRVLSRDSPAFSFFQLSATTGRNGRLHLRTQLSMRVVSRFPIIGARSNEPQEATMDPRRCGPALYVTPSGYCSTTPANGLIMKLLGVLNLSGISGRSGRWWVRIDHPPHTDPHGNRRSPSPGQQDPPIDRGSDQLATGSQLIGATTGDRTGQACFADLAAGVPQSRPRKP